MLREFLIHNIMQILKKDNTRAFGSGFFANLNNEFSLLNRALFLMRLFLGRLIISIFMLIIYRKPSQILIR